MNGERILYNWMSYIREQASPVDDDDRLDAAKAPVKESSGRSGTIVRTLLTVLVVGVVLSSIDLGVFTDSGLRIRGLHLGIACALAPVFLLLKAAKWHMLARTVRDVSFKKSVRSFMVGMSVGVLTPGRVGEVARASQFEGDRSKMVTLVAVDKAMDVLVVVILGIVFGLSIVPPALTAAYVVVAALALAFLARPFAAVTRSAAALELLPWVGESSLPEEIKGAVVSPPTSVLFKTLILTVLAYGTVMVQFHFLLLGFGAILNLGTTLAVLPIVVLVKSVPLTIASLGVREGTAMFAFGAYDVKPEVAVAAAFASFLVTTAVAALAGLTVVWDHRPENGGPGPR